ncbi:uncharacterized protein CC84DRAFT_417324 [Paraphaeosphaeria sporulosa]|uniref:Uncharacterized protein n=1 Tax=Paraphaeosphaeria sporulosa TaxID=1460663 RepID=A0A177BUY9_9PLEO|nr:uncharacterized protein CC84DRAFT_417324 [Paraphaeosphaeria sporulosa]OAF99124.1 hypothetical protein CC84DRAFT_417324 [Paraphaeosphaeria sporulosa]
MSHECTATPSLLLGIQIHRRVPSLEARDLFRSIEVRPSFDGIPQFLLVIDRQIFFSQTLPVHRLSVYRHDVLLAILCSWVELVSHISAVSGSVLEHLCSGLGLRNGKRRCGVELRVEGLDDLVEHGWTFVAIVEALGGVEEILDGVIVGVVEREDFEGGHCVGCVKSCVALVG